MIRAFAAETRETYGRVQDDVQGASVAMDPTNGDIRALVRVGARNEVD